MPRPDVKVRLAQDDEARVVANLVSEIFDMDGWMPEFEHVFPHWLVAEIAGEVVATLNIRIALPISTIELLAVDPLLNKLERATVVVMLLDTAVTICAAAGSTAFTGMIPDHLGSYRQVVEDKGWTEMAHGAMMITRLR